MTPLQYPYYFGCVRYCGHFSFTQHLQGANVDISVLLRPFDGQHHYKPYNPKQPSVQLEGAAGITYLPDLDATLLAFWDRSVDTREGSWSGFFLPGQHPDPQKTIALARELFPRIWERYTFEVSVQFVHGFETLTVSAQV